MGNKGWLYMEFRFPIKDYFSCLNRKEFVYEWIVPLIAALIALIIVVKSGKTIGFAGFAKYVGGFVTILIGFSITSVTILTTAGGSHIKEIKATKSERIINNIRISVYKLMHVNFTFALFSEIMTLILVTILYTLEFFKASICVRYTLFSLVCVFIVHVILLNIRNITCFYLLFHSDDE